MPRGTLGGADTAVWQKDKGNEEVIDEQSLSIKIPFEEEITMIKLFAGEKGEGKTRKLIALANDHLNVTDGHIVFIDDDRRNIHEIHRNIRLVDTSEYPLLNYREFISFIHGMLSQNSDISEIFIDSLSGIIKELDNSDTSALMTNLESVSKSNDVDFFITLNCNPAELPENVKKHMV